jgi:hypothetical protein
MARVDPELVKYVEKHLSKGVELKQIKRTLADVGHPIDAIEDAAAFVTNKQPELKRAPRKMMIVYGLILILVLAGFGWYIWFKATQQIEYTQTVQQIEQNRSYIGMTDVELLKLAASENDITACRFIRSHDTYYACIGRYWQREDCSFAKYTNELESCYVNKAQELQDISYCDSIRDKGRRDTCKESVFSAIRSSKDYSKCRGESACLDYTFSQDYASLDYSFCSNYADAYREDNCLFNLSVSRADLKRCDEIADIQTRQGCRASMAKTADDLLAICKSRENIAADVPEDEQKLSCFIGVTAAAIGKGIYTCDALIEFVRSHQDTTFLQEFDSEFRVFASSLESGEWNDRIKACAR